MWIKITTLILIVIFALTKGFEQLEGDKVDNPVEIQSSSRSFAPEMAGAQFRRLNSNCKEDHHIDYDGKCKHVEATILPSAIGA
ncbi:Hypothetical predicted protein [Cloeon dipterum]|uniref:Uncharacterized protein n=1 Tax=Cloeon dipterum TaxID=197152 RepID=A0A8S1BYN2_9INSE|nr:Hypothetical predicted protein [Cloeon dipterum]